MNRTLQRTLLMLSLAACGAVPAWAQAPPADPAATPPPAAATQAADDPDRDPNDAQPDFYVATIPTTLRLPRHKMAFRLTHRFGRPLGQGDFSDLLADFFGFDSGAVMGFELRYGLFRGAQIGVNRTSGRTIQLFGQYEVVSQKSSPVGVSLVANVDGTNNFSDTYSPGFQAVVSREISDRAAVYLVPAFVNNSNPSPSALVDDNNTALIGLGTRVRIRKNTYVTLEASPRVMGYDPGVTLISFGFEQRAGGHVFQLNFSNGFGTTLAQVARGGTGKDDWYIGFNLSRKFF